MSKMTSYFARHRRFSRQTQEWAHYGAYPRSLDDRLQFYMNYLLDVVPLGVTVHHLPTGLEENKSEEIHLLTPSGQIFMTGLVGRQRNHTTTEEVAGSEAYTKWLDGDFVPDGQNWRFFTGLAELRFFNSDRGNSWELKQSCHPMNYPDYVAEFLQEEYDSLRYH